MRKPIFRDIAAIANIAIQKSTWTVLRKHVTKHYRHSNTQQTEKLLYLRILVKIGADEIL